MFVLLFSLLTACNKNTPDEILTAPFPSSDSVFGFSICFSPDGKTLAIGEYLDYTSQKETGSVNLFEKKMVGSLNKSYLLQSLTLITVSETH
jgi:hypothetical protein